MRKAIEIAAEWDFRQVNGFSITKDELEHRRMATLSLMVSVLTEMCCAVKPWFCQGMPRSTVRRLLSVLTVSCTLSVDPLSPLLSILSKHSLMLRPLPSLVTVKPICAPFYGII